MKMLKVGVIAVLAVALAGCGSLKEFCCGPECPKISVFVSHVRRIAQQRDVSYEEAARLLKEAGVSGFDCSYGEALLPRLAKSALKPVNLYGGIDFSSLEVPVAQEDAFIATAVRFGVPRIMVIPHGFVEGERSEICYGKIRDGLIRMSEKARRAGLVMTIEDYGGTNNICSYAKYIKRLLTDVPDLDYALDSGNLYYAGRGDDILDLMRFAEGRIAHVHLKDQTTEDNHRYASIGLGAVPNEKIVRHLAAKGYGEWFTLENPVGPDWLDDFKRQIAVLRRWYAQGR